ncbi:uncharacterized protein CCOS01_15595 [Colletotrichum costaricense]|uniref:Uncharacterized protein n=2 Tax=Colletotrichum acutatum species complex TaxID=2707335 RepID=A0AAI9YHR3_9PEZI|nr:uncharacterized protein CCOS01_15595 [Colletotrichum costaricense]XP_060381771.1 uncharacterized protein CTAM01_07695 [Colletotrichum tamarilloi]KAK1498058.1 hypothetical protein CTAM01_07695 [Colletotrichum tamarilloi]KAK1509501.1 hypothetical protein CCOS01_15595 [Colletotrichum costaricense]
MCRGPGAVFGDIKRSCSLRVELAGACGIADATRGKASSFIRAFLEGKPYHCSKPVMTMLLSISHDLGKVVAAENGESIVRFINSRVSLTSLFETTAIAYEEAARAAGRSLSSGTYYYFMNCALGPAQSSVPLVQWANSAHGCSHVGLVVGKTARFGVKKFKAVYIHIRLWDTGFSQSQHDYTPYENQKLVYGGKTTSSKANLNRLVDAGIAWLEDAGYELTEEHNCVAHY